MADPTAALHAVRASTADLLKGLAEHRWSDGELAAPSLCDGWTRGHVLTHLARNADATAATLAGALRGEVVPRYPDGPAGRDADIEAGAGRPVAEVVADVAESAERLDRVFAAVGEAGRWDAPTDRDVPAGEWALRRLVEVELHRVDLAGDYSPDRWPPLLIIELLPDAVESLTGRADVPVRIVVTEDGSVAPSSTTREWTTGAGDPVEVRGPDWALLAWASGRGAAVRHALGGELPELRPWR